MMQKTTSSPLTRSPSPVRIIAALQSGGVIAYPTEGVYGIGCLPDRPAAIRRVIDIKGRDAAKGLILIAAHPKQLYPWVDLDMLGGEAVLDAAVAAITGPRACTFVVPASDRCSALITGGRPTVAVRVSRFPHAAALCARVDSALISTSANLTGRPAIRNPHLLHRTFGNRVDAIYARRPGQQHGVSQIIDLESGKILRA